MEKQYSPNRKEIKLKDKEKMIQKGKEEEPMAEVKTQKEEKNNQKEIIRKETVPKEDAIVNGFSLGISAKTSKYICKAIMNKSIEKAIELLKEVTLKKKAIRMDGAEIPHRKGMMSGRYPINAAKEIIELLKQLKANAIVNKIENPIIVLAIANKAQLPFKREGRRGKRAHIYIKVIEKTKMSQNKK